MSEMAHKPDPDRSLDACCRVCGRPCWFVRTGQTATAEGIHGYWRHEARARKEAAK